MSNLDAIKNAWQDLTYAKEVLEVMLKRGELSDELANIAKTHIFSSIEQIGFTKTQLNTVKHS